jgi:hypothetical protein
MLLLLYLSFCEWGFNIFCIAFCVQKAIYICTSLKNFVIFLTSLPLCVKVFHFVMWCCESMYVFCFYGTWCILFDCCYGGCYKCVLYK